MISALPTECGNALGKGSTAVDDLSAHSYIVRMKRTFSLALLLSISSVATATAAFTLTFDADLEGFEAQENATALEQSSANGGSMKLTANGGCRQQLDI